MCLLGGSTDAFLPGGLGGGGHNIICIIRGFHHLLGSTLIKMPLEILIHARTEHTGRGYKLLREKTAKRERTKKTESK